MRPVIGLECHPAPDSTPVGISWSGWCLDLRSCVFTADAVAAVVVAAAAAAAAAAAVAKAYNENVVIFFGPTF